MIGGMKIGKDYVVGGNIALIVAALLLGAQIFMGTQVIANNYFALLSELDRKTYVVMQEEFKSKRYLKRRQALAIWSQQFAKIKEFVRNDLVHGLVCGVIWSGPYVARNIKKLHNLTGKSVALLRDRFARQGYKIIPNGTECIENIVRLYFLAISKLPPQERIRWVICELPGAEEAIDDHEIPETTPSVPARTVADNIWPQADLIFGVRGGEDVTADREVSETATSATQPAQTGADERFDEGLFGHFYGSWL
jgi:hypothetical protein